MGYWIYIVASILILPGIIYGIVAQANVNRTFNTYKTVESTSGKTASEVARNMLDSAGLNDIKIQKISGNLTDNYNPKTKVLSLSDSTYDSKSVAAIGVAAHEVGHAIQQQVGYGPFKARSAIVPVVNFSNFLFWPLLIVGVVLCSVSTAWATAGEIVVWVAVALYGSSTLFYLITVPVEYNASNRALALLETGIISPDEVPYASQVLRAAAQTYVAALITSAIYFLRFFGYILMIFGGGKKKK